MRAYHTVLLLPQGQQAEAVAVRTPLGEYRVVLHLGDDGALVVYIDTDELVEPTPAVLRVNVNGGPVFGYGQDIGAPTQPPRR